MSHHYSTTVVPLYNSRAVVQGHIYPARGRAGLRNRPDGGTCEMWQARLMCTLSSRRVTSASRRMAWWPWPMMPTTTPTTWTSTATTPPSAWTGTSERLGVRGAAALGGFSWSWSYIFLFSILKPAPPLPACAARPPARPRRWSPGPWPGGRSSGMVDRHSLSVCLVKKHIRQYQVLDCVANFDARSLLDFGDSGSRGRGAAGRGRASYRTREVDAVARV